MKILIEGGNYENYFAKVHEACKTGLRSVFNARCYGEGYPFFYSDITSFVDMKYVLFGDEDIDLILLTDCWNPKKLEEGIRYCDLEKLDCKKAIMLCDFWSEADCQKEKYIRFIKQNNIDYIFTYFRAPFYLWKNLEIHSKLIWYPPCFDPRIFNDWHYEKIYDVGNLNAGIFAENPFYPERFQIHKKLLKMKNIKYYYAKHPGVGILPSGTPLIGKSFSEAINRCKIFITTGSLMYRNFTPKYIEAMASKACLFANEPLDAELIGLIDGVNYVKITENDIEDKIRYYLDNEDERISIAEKGHQLVMNKYSCYKQAEFVFNQLIDELGE